MSEFSFRAETLILLRANKVFTDEEIDIIEQVQEIETAYHRKVPDIEAICETHGIFYNKTVVDSTRKAVMQKYLEEKTPIRKFESRLSPKTKGSTKRVESIKDPVLKKNLIGFNTIIATLAETNKKNKLRRQKAKLNTNSTVRY